MLIPQYGPLLMLTISMACDDDGDGDGDLISMFRFVTFGVVIRRLFRGR
jgi:hypothetical protein